MTKRIVNNKNLIKKENKQNRLSPLIIAGIVCFLVSFVALIVFSVLWFNNDDYWIAFTACMVGFSIVALVALEFFIKKTIYYSKQENKGKPNYNLEYKLSITFLSLSAVLFLTENVLWIVKIIYMSV